MKIIITVIWIHFLSDFIMQSDKIALNKSERIDKLLMHCLIYMFPFLIINFWYAIINGLLHFIIDLFSSKICKYFYGKDQRHWFFVTIGADQAMHMNCLFITLNLLEIV